jgi:hypothetical protein
MEYLQQLINNTRTITPPQVRKCKIKGYLLKNGYKPINMLPNLFLNDSGQIYDLNTYKQLPKAKCNEIIKSLEKTKTATHVLTSQMKRRDFIKYLTQKGYKRIKTLPNLFLNDSGQIYDLNTGRKLTAIRNTYIRYCGRYLNIAKLVLLTFKKEQIRGGQIRFIDGNKSNISTQNLEYVTKYNDRKHIDRERLKTAIRCYFEVEKKYNTKNHIQTRIFLKHIISTRLFYYDYSKRPHIDVFKSYMNGIINNCANVSKMHGITVRDCNYIINDFINLLVNDILTDMQNGILQTKEYYKKLTNTDYTRQTNEYLKKRGLKPLPLRKKAKKETLNVYIKHSNQIKSMYYGND